MRAWLAEVAGHLALLGTIAGGAATLAGFVGSLWWVFDLLAHFRLQLLCGLLVCAVVLSARRSRIAAAAAGALAIANFVVVAPLWFDEPRPAIANSPELSLTLFNVHASNRERDRVIDYLARSDSDVIAVLEVDRALYDRLESELPGDARVVTPFEYGLPIVEATVRFADRELALFAVHPMPPVGGANTARRDRLLAEVAGRVAAIDRPVVVIGDLNATPFSAGFRIIRGDLINSQDGFGYQATWSPPWILGVPIDHVLHSRELTTLDRRVGPPNGSDHRPVHVTLGLAKD